jgi:hypothetical protein
MSKNKPARDERSLGLRESIKLMCRNARHLWCYGSVISVVSITRISGPAQIIATR